MTMSLFFKRLSIGEGEEERRRRKYTVFVTLLTLSLHISTIIQGSDVVDFVKPPVKSFQNPHKRKAKTTACAENVKNKSLNKSLNQVLLQR